MVIGFFLRRLVTVALCAGAFWAGVKADNLLAAGIQVPAVDCTEAQSGDL